MEISILLQDKHYMVPERKPRFFGQKLEIRNNDRNQKCSNDKNFEFPKGSFRSFCHLVFEFVSSFEFRVSDLA